MTTAPPADLDASFRRLRLGDPAPAIPGTAVDSQDPALGAGGVLRTLLDAEIASQDASNVRERLRQAAFPVAETLDEFNVAKSSVKAATFGYRSSLEWVRRRRTCAWSPVNGQVKVPVVATRSPHPSGVIRPGWASGPPPFDRASSCGTTRPG